MPSSVIIADDHPVVVAGVETILKAHRYDVVARAHDTDTLFDALSDHPCDVVVTDYSMPEGSQPDGMPMIRRIRATRPDTPNSSSPSRWPRWRRARTESLSRFIPIPKPHGATVCRACPWTCSMT